MLIRGEIKEPYSLTVGCFERHKPSTPGPLERAEVPSNKKSSAWSNSMCDVLGRRRECRLAIEVACWMDKDKGEYDGDRL